MKARRGLTIIELLMTLTVVSLLATIAVPKYRDVKRQARATQMMGDFDVLRHAAMSFYVDSGYFPAEARSAQLPLNLGPYLPNGFSMTKPEWTIDYENWETRARTRTRTGITVGVSFVTADSALGRTAMRLIGNAPAYTVGQKYTFLISGY